MLIMLTYCKCNVSRVFLLLFDNIIDLSSVTTAEVLPDNFRTSAEVLPDNFRTSAKVLPDKWHCRQAMTVKWRLTLG